MTKTTAMLDAALEYASRGYNVFPIEPLAKTPLIPVSKGGKGVHDSTTDKSQIETWWHRCPTANIACHCIAHWVLDVDTKSNGPAALDGLIRTYGPLPETLSQTTGSGGKHYFFKSPIGIFIRNQSGFYPGLDVRSYGGYVLLAPSETESGHYTWDNDLPIADAPEWLLKIVSDKREGFKSPERSDCGRRDIDDASLAGYLLNGGCTEDEIFSVLQSRNNDPDRRDVPLPTNEIWKTVRSIAKRDIRTPAGLRQALHENAVRIKAEGASVAKPDPMWMDRMIGGVKPKNCLANAEAALVHAPLFCNSLAFDELRAEVRLTRNIVDPISENIIGNLSAGAVVDEHAIREMTAIAQRLVTEVLFLEDTIGAASQMVARKNRFHPVQDYLNGLIWDGKPRIDTWLIDHIGVADDEDGYARGVGRRWLISAVNRALVPGSKADCALIIEGPQGIGKSPALSVLAGQDWFKDSPIDFNSKDKFGSVKGVWIYELGEFDQYRAADAATVKNFLSSQYDTYRPAYGRSDVKQPRGCVFVGTTNKEKYLVDETGNKRFWPVRSIRHSRSNPINLKRIAAERDQIWAEAVRAYYAGEPGFIDMPNLMIAHERQAMDRHDTDDTWESIVLDYMVSVEKSKRAIQTSDVLLNALGLAPKEQGNRERDRVKRILERRGYTYVSQRVEGSKNPVKTWKPRTEQQNLL